MFYSQWPSQSNYPGRLNPWVSASETHAEFITFDRGLETRITFKKEALATLYGHH